MNNVGTRRVAVVNDTSSYVGPALARTLAARGHDLVIGDAIEGLVGELESTGARVEVVSGVRWLRSQDVLHGIPRRNEWVHDRAVRRLRRRMGLSPPA